MVAHELIERGFDVLVFERRDIAGGKARSVPVSDLGERTSGHQLAASDAKFLRAGAFSFGSGLYVSK